MGGGERQKWGQPRGLSVVAFQVNRHERLKGKGKEGKKNELSGAKRSWQPISEAEYMLLGRKGGCGKKTGGNFRKTTRTQSYQLTTLNSC